MLTSACVYPELNSPVVVAYFRDKDSENKFHKIQ